MKEKLKNIFYLFFPLALGSIVGLIMKNSIDYNNLTKPFLSPPSIFFPIAWTIIYILMGISYYLYKKDYNYLSKIDYIYYIQLFFNLLWSIIFFVFKLRLLSIIWIITLDILVIYLIILLYKKKKISAYLNSIYIIWILFATYLNIGIYLLN